MQTTSNTPAKPHYHFSLYVLIPFIFCGLVTIEGLVIYYTAKNGGETFWPAAFWILLINLLALLFSVNVVWLFLKPIRRFLQQAAPIVPLQDRGAKPAVLNREEPLREFSSISNRVTELISMIEVRERFPEIQGISGIMQEVLSMVARIAPSDTTVLILGESGTGKELIARSLHAQSLRREGPFVAVNCAGIPLSLLESELFGYEKGAFTGADHRHPGKFEQAQGGSVFLDEVGDMPPSTQAKILRVLQEHEIERLGGYKPIPVDVRFIAATNKNLEEMVQKGEFREDLFFRINAFCLKLPPLRCRREDIPVLADYFLNKSYPEKYFSNRTLSAMTSYNWPGNIRELENVTETAAALADEEIDIPHLPAAVARPELIVSYDTGTSEVPRQSLDATLADLEKGMIIEALTRSGGIQKRAADMLGIKERSLWHRIAKYKIDAQAIKEGGRLTPAPPVRIPENTKA